MIKKKGKKLKVLSTKQTTEDLISGENSFLHEISFDVTIDNNIRKEIEKKFQKSSVNAAYVFPRLGTPIKSHARKKSARAKSLSQPKTSSGKFLSVTKKIHDSNHKSRTSKSNLDKKIPRAESFTKRLKEDKGKFGCSSSNTPLVPHNRSISQCSKRPKTPVLNKENALKNLVKRTKFRHKRKESEKVCKGADGYGIDIKKFGHSYTGSAGNQCLGLFENF